MQLNKHNVETPPKGKPKWLRKGVALLAAIATLATGGVVASTAYAEGDTGGGGVSGGGPVGGTGSMHLEWTYKDGGTGWGPASDWNSTKAAMTAMGWHNLDDSEGGSSVAWMQQATSQANANCIARVKSKYPDAPEDPNMCRVVGVGAVGTPGKQFGYGAGASHNIWMDYWHQVVDGVAFNNGGGPSYYTSDAFTVDPSLSVDKIADTWAPDFANGQSTGTIVVIALSRYEPAPAAFTPTISTEAPHIIQEGQPITDRVTVGVKQGDQWIDGTSITAKGYYFTGSKDLILNQRQYSGDKTDAAFQTYINQIKSAGGKLLGTKTETFTGPGQHTVTLDQKAPANTWGTWVFDSKTSGPVCAHMMSSALRPSSSPRRWKRPAGACSGSPR